MSKEIDRIEANTKWNTKALMNGATATVNIQVGDASGNANQMAIAFKDWGQSCANGALGVGY